MTEHGPRIGAARDVPPPRPVAPAPPVAEETGLGRAARAVADAVSGLVGAAAGRTGTTPSGTARAAGTGLRNAVSAVAGAVGAALSDARRPSAAEPPTGDTTPGVLREVLAAAAPRLPIRTGTQLRDAYPGLSDEEIADALLARAARATSGIGAGTGGLSAARWVGPASLLTLPIALGGETLLVAGVEVVLVGELHELYGRPAPGDARARAEAYVASWSEHRLVDGGATAGLGGLLGAAGVRALRTQIPRRLAGAMPSAGPFMLGAALAGRGNRRATEALAERIRDRLRRPPPPGPGT